MEHRYVPLLGVFLVLFVGWIFLFRWYGTRNWFVILLLSYWLSFIIFVMILCDECTRVGTGVPKEFQWLIAASIIIVFVAFTGGLIYLALHCC